MASCGITAGDKHIGKALSVVSPLYQVQRNRSRARRGHVTNAPVKQQVVILLMPKIDRTHKNYLTSEI